MARRARKPHKKQEQPWTKAARAKNRTAAGGTEQADMEAVADAVIEMAGLEIDALPPDATEEQLNTVLGFATMVYNQPLFEANPQIRAQGDTLAAALWKMLSGIFEAVPNSRAIFDRMTAHRKLLFGHLKRPILAFEASWDEKRQLTVSMNLGAEDLHDVVAEDETTPPQ